MKSLGYQVDGWIKGGGGCTVISLELIRGHVIVGVANVSPALRPEGQAGYKALKIWLGL